MPKKCLPNGFDYLLLANVLFLCEPFVSIGLPLTQQNRETKKPRINFSLSIKPEKETIHCL